MKQSEAVADGAFSTSAARRALVGSFFGTALETYDVIILFGTAAGLILNRLFFPGTDPLAGTLYAFGALAVGFVARPIGGLIIGKYGDRVGRKPMLFLTLGLMGLVTALIGLLPTYAQIGIFAPVLLTLVGRHDEIQRTRKTG
jgi:MFS family permease